jgi:hypothetical protein
LINREEKIAQGKEVYRSNKALDILVAEIFVAKLLRASGGCLGAKRRRKTW